MPGSQHQKHGAEQQLVGDWVEVLPQHRLLLQQAGEQAVQTIGDPGSNKERQSPPILALDHGNDRDRDKNKSQQSKQVRGRFKL